MDWVALFEYAMELLVRTADLIDLFEYATVALV